MSMKYMSWIIVFTCFIIALCVQLWLEEKNMVDSLGMWYSVLVALAYGLPIAGIIVFLLKVIQGVIKRSRK